MSIEIDDFDVNCDYSYEEIHKVENAEILSYGEQWCGTHAIHLREMDSNEPTNVWFIYTGYNGHGGIFTCVYNN